MSTVIDVEDKVQKSLDTIVASTGDIAKKQIKLETDHAEFSKTLKQFEVESEALRKDLNTFRRAYANRVDDAAFGRKRVTDDCARHLTAIAIVNAEKRGLLNPVESKAREFMLGASREILGAEFKTALTSSDIPLPIEYSGQVVSLVAEYGQARRFMTVYPLGAGTVKLPKLKTSPAFGLIAQSAVVTEKSPQTESVTFTPSKWGGLVRIPNELDADSIVPIGQFIGEYSAREMAKLEDTVCFVADASGTYDSLSGMLKQQDAAATRVVMASTKTHNSDLTLANAREMRSKVASAALRKGAYYFHPSFEQLFSSFNAAGDKPYEARAAQGATLDGYPINWVDVLPAYSTAVAASQLFGAFGDASYVYLGLRGSMRFTASQEAGFTTDEILILALERFTVGHMATDHACVVKTAAS